MTDPTATTAIAPGSGAELFGHPRGLATLFLTEMWERFTYYGMRAILVLFLVGAVEGGGLGIDDKTGNAIYGLYISGTYLLSLWGGWIADRLIGAQRAVWWGGILIMVGNGLLAVGSTQLFFLGLVFIAFGVGLLKPNISAIVAQIYPEGGSRRDAGFSIFYMGINVGAFLGSTIVPILAATYGWRAGFGASAVGMALGLAQFAMHSPLPRCCRCSARRVASRRDEQPSRVDWDSSFSPWRWWLICGAAILGIISIDPVELLNGSFWAMVAFSVGYFAYLLFFAGLNTAEQKRVLVMIALFVACAMFWAGFEQTGASLNLFADRYTDRDVFGWNMPAGVLQNVNPFFIIVFSPLFAALWVWLGQAATWIRRRRPNSRWVWS